MTDKAFVIVSGLPASGKTTLALGISTRLGLPVVDKDTILEALYDSLGIGDGVWRQRLSRAADEVLFALAAEAGQAVLVNWWHHDTAPARLRGLGARLVEVYCDCDPGLAAQRFRARRRHPGHLDPDLSDEQVAKRIAALRESYPGPLRLGGPTAIVDTSGPVDTVAVAARVGALLHGTATPQDRHSRPLPVFNSGRALTSEGMDDAIYEQIKERAGRKPRPTGQ
ncbi:AAA family ATPase [Streptomyces himalayensis]|uniref:AAA family ATPase n=1 Tax=Streptomyces himalayensis subsp. himalayensis TaxID=2756131 RepID=A0A7W0IB39_9ACTN|nr:AAA family ATPase [Streptomyces himalayensis]MBA2948771.1 AAA family ATPase [Streptomyces himalayensis subsp. himalayensis]